MVVIIIVVDGRPGTGRAQCRHQFPVAVQGSLFRSPFVSGDCSRAILDSTESYGFEAIEPIVFLPLTQSNYSDRKHSFSTVAH